MCALFEGAIHEPEDIMDGGVYKAALNFLIKQISGIPPNSCLKYLTVIQNWRLPTLSHLFHRNYQFEVMKFLTRARVWSRVPIKLTPLYVECKL